MTVVADRYVGRSGQQLLLPRLPFCPGRDCHRRCGVGDCTCRPCGCPRCAHRLTGPGANPVVREFRAPGALPRPLFLSPFDPNHKEDR